MDERGLRELELLPVARLYGLDQLPAAAPAPRPLRAFLATPRGGAEATWMFVDGDGLEDAARRLLDHMLAAVGCEIAREVSLEDPGAVPAARMVVALGERAAARLLGTGETLDRLRGRVHALANAPLVATFSPESLLSRGADKALAWKDLVLARRTLLERLSLKP